jgi:hypothetical protein
MNAPPRPDRHGREKREQIAPVDPRLDRHLEHVLMNRKQVEALLECLLESADGVALNAPLRSPPRPASQQQATVNVSGILL